jgi:two-component system, sensor histidine kinase and response regulator
MEPKKIAHNSQSYEVSWTAPGSNIQFHGDAPVLVVEDNPVNARVVSWMLTKMGFKVHTVANGKEAIDAMLQTDYAFVLMDCHMPVMDGLTATMKLRNIEAQIGKHNIIIGYSASCDELTCLSAGMDDFILKPTTPAVVEQKVSRWYERRAA